MSSPVSEETLEELRESAKETAKQFGISYTLNIAWTLYERAREAAENSEPNSLRLQYRKFETVVRTDLLAGYVDVRSGEGPGAMGSWKKVYCVERSDYGIELYANKGAFQKHRKPKATIRPRGYTVVTKHVAKPFRKLIEPVAEGLGIDKGALHGILDFPQESWALFHPQRTKYVFRTCKKSRFARNKKKPPSVTADDEAIDRKEWIYFLKTCVRKAKSRDTDTVLGKAFDRTCEKISEKVEALKDWKDDGTEDEMLLEMLMTSCLPPVLDIVLSQVKGQLSIPLAPFGSFASVIASRVLIPVWFKTVGILKKAIQTVLSKAWTKIQEEAQAVFDKVEPVLRRGLEKVTKVHNTILDTIKNATNKTLGALLSKAVTPLIEPLLKVYAKPLTDGFTFVRETYWTSVTSDDLPKGETERKDFLDAIPRKRKTMRKVYTYAVEMSEGLHTAKKLINSIMRTLGCDSDEDDDEEDEEDDDLCAEAEESLLKSLDATVHTLYLRLENGEKMNDALMENILTEQFDADAILLKRDIVKKGTRQFVLRYFKKAIKANEDISGAIEKADSFIPSEMKDFLSVEGIFDGFIDIVVGEPIVLMVEAAKMFR